MMYVIAIVMFMGPEYKVASNQMLYNELYLTIEDEGVSAKDL